jgi:hypothetical protein
MKKSDTVICIDAAFHPRTVAAVEHLPTQNGIYTVREVHLFNGAIPAIRLEELINRPQFDTDHPQYGLWEPSFAATRFRLYVPPAKKEKRVVQLEHSN